ncbi:MAG: addiction module toxin RelE [Candidatus Accumulibacter phosphatis]|uniref:Addiction module toxin RelE n=1 Tax=Candidatus Accumulibacter phosphatis TaxID=327160 RepID=A0A6A7RV02_9PROT|nr:addiction module toxin RelE [Candidatus Accumulibacter phosphatis]
MIYSLHPEAESDLREAAEYYRERGGNPLAQALFAEFEHAMHLLLEHPMLGAVWLHGSRRLVIKHFPYSIAYSLAGQDLRVLAIVHHSRRPGYWRKRKW